jgi:PAS domain-containing protein
MAERKKTSVVSDTNVLLDIEMYFNIVFNTIGDPVFVKDKDSKLLFVNDAFCLLFTTHRNDIIGKLWLKRSQ